mgnify:CR=1 FL=1
MNTRIITIALIALAISGCQGTAMNRDVLRQHVARNCRVQAATASAYALDSTGIDLDNVALDRCMRAAGFTDTGTANLAQAAPGRRQAGSGSIQGAP